ncbi:LacI family DNA-binding transcriptional regulator [Microbacterium gorillae]|uniref:LacI family DNA-binding transcriptional regulator n=1 Tax=Microbacterium gorillae TaxID=1231063 RepID=UPI00058AF157|nr:LacI family DNA-binding transcriptional regulator [Microbacterium gorillae]
MPPVKRVTIADIARIAGVSPGAVSFALNGKPGVSEATRERILQVAQDQKWSPSQAARALVGARANAIGLVLNRPARSLGTEAFFADLIAGIQAGLSDGKLSLQLRLVSSFEEELETHRHWHAAHQVDGVLLIDPRDDDPRQRALEELGVPTVVVGSHASAPGSAPAVWLDDAATAHELFDYLAALGHTRIAYVAGPEEFDHTRLRTAVLDGLSARGVSSETMATDFSPAVAGTVTRRLLSAAKRPTAIVYDNDVMAVAGLRVLQEMGVAVPADVSVASFDDSVIAELVRPSITSMTRDTFALGQRAAALLLRQIDASEPLPSEAGATPTLTVRESTARPV